MFYRDTCPDISSKVYATSLPTQPLTYSKIKIKQLYLIIFLLQFFKFHLSVRKWLLSHLMSFSHHPEFQKSTKIIILNLHNARPLIKYIKLYMQKFNNYSSLEQYIWFITCNMRTLFQPVLLQQFETLDNIFQGWNRHY